MNTGPDTSDKMPCGARGWAGYAGDIASLLLRVRATDSGGKELSVDAAVRRWADMAEELRGKLREAGLPAEIVGKVMERQEMEILVAGRK